MAAEGVGRIMPGAFNKDSELPMPFPVIQSLLAPQALVKDYDLKGPVECKLLAHNLNDTYLVSTAERRYVLRVSQAPRIAGRTWRSAFEILYELDLLRHLQRKGSAVAVPVARKSGTLLNLIQAPEGPRVAVLFTYAPGEPVRPAKQTPALSTAYGRSIAEMHTASDDFSSAHPRFSLDLAFLLDTPLKVIQPLLIHRLHDWSYLLQLADFLKARIAQLSMQALDRGACHGDAQGGNAMLSGANRLTFFDFDVCGTGWRAYDLAVFYWGMALGKSRLGWDDQQVERLWAAYLEGYQTSRPLGEPDLKAIPLFVAVRHFWFFGLNAANWDYWGWSEVDDAFFDRELAFLRAWVTQRIERL
jgi:Ser/Thr protein kinase RdoA (MazF antagonist)